MKEAPKTFKTGQKQFLQDPCLYNMYKQFLTQYISPKAHSPTCQGVVGEGDTILFTRIIIEFIIWRNSLLMWGLATIS